MINPKSLTAFEEKISKATKSNLPMPSTEFKTSLSKNLFNQSIEVNKKNKSFNLKSVNPARAVVFIVIAIALISVFVAGPQKIYAAIQNLLRYIPGIGFVETNRELTEPITVEREGILFTVQSMVVTKEETVLVYYVEYLPIGELGEYCESLKITYSLEQCTTPEPSLMLRTSDGSLFEGQRDYGFTTDKFIGTDWTGRVVFPSLPVDINQVDLLLNYLPNMFEGMAPENWVIPIELRISDGNTEPSIVYQPSFSTVAPDSTDMPLIVESTETEPLPELKNEIDFILDAVSITESELTLSISVQWERDSWNGAGIVYSAEPIESSKANNLPHLVTLVDANGVEIPLVYNSMESFASQYPDKTSTFILNGDVSELEFANPLTLKLDGILFYSNLSEEKLYSVQFEPKGDLLPGECEEISQTFSIYDSQITIVQACFIENPRSHGGGGGPNVTPLPPPKFALELHTELSSMILGISIADYGCILDAGKQQTNCRGAYGMPGDEGMRINGTLFDQMPTWPIEYRIMAVDFLLEGPWVIEFDLPEMP